MMNRKIDMTIGALMLAVLCLVSQSVWSSPSLINFQGVLRDVTGQPVTDTIAMGFEIFEHESEGDPGAGIWQETHPGVDVENGVYSVLLGATATGTLSPNLFAGNNLWIEVTINGEIMTPRQHITSVAYAMNADSLNGEEASFYDQSAHANDTTENPHNIDATDVGAATPDDVAAQIAAHQTLPNTHHSKTTLFSEITGTIGEAQVPASIARDTELDWNLLANIPLGFADGIDDVGSETDPEVGANQLNYVSRWNGSALVKGNIYDNGNVGIGTSGPTQRLDVRGNIAVTGTVDGRDIASDGAVLDSLASSGSADTTNDSWTGVGDVYTTAGTVSIGTSSSDGNQLKVRSITSGKAAVQAIGQYPFLTTYNTSVIGQLAVQDPGGLAVSPADVGVLGSIPSFGGGSSVGVYGSNSSVLTSSSNYGVYALANGTGTSATNYGLYAAAANGQTNWAGYFDGNTSVVGNFEVSNNVLINGTGTSSGLTIGSDQSVDARIYHTTSALRVDGPNARVQFGSSEYIEDCGSYCVELSSASAASGVVQIIGDTTVTGNITLKSPSTGNVLLELGEGLDYAEGFNVSETGEIVSGTVLIIDPENPGQLTTSREAYDSRVAGIVAGANGLGSGVRLGVANFDTDVALAGRVYCQVEAMHGPIKPGDLLTTSGIAGHAMRATDFHRAQGAILGKAMESLAQGETGKILVLVSLQ